MFYKVFGLLLVLVIVLGIPSEGKDWPEWDNFLKTPPHGSQSQNLPKGCWTWETVVNCYGQEVDSLPVDLPNGTKTFQLLDTSIRKLTNGMFYNYSQIEALNIGMNRLDAIENGAFAELGNLKHLALVSVDLNETEFKDGILQDLKLLEILNLQKNSLDDIPKLHLTSLTHLKYLDLSYNEINQIQGNVMSLDSGSVIFPPNLVSLTLAGNNFASFDPKILNGLDSLQQLDLGRNSMKKFMPDLCSKSESLETVFLYENKLSHSTLKGAFDNCVSINTLDLSGNEISENIPQDTFQNMKQLKELSLAHNMLQHVPSAVFKPSLVLQDLDLSGNPIRDIENDTFIALKDLKILKLSDTLIRCIETSAFNGLNKLTSLDLSLNKLNFLDENTFLDLLSLDRLDFSGNPLICSCTLQWMVEAVEANKTWAKKWGTFTPSPKCYYPKHLRGEAIETFLPVDLTCSRPSIDRVTPKRITLGENEELEIEVKSD